MSTLRNYALVVLLVVGAFALGTLYTKNTFLEKQLLEAKGSPVAVAPTAGGTAPTQPTAPVVPQNVKVTIKDSDPIKGDPKAKVTVVEYADFQCPFCERFFTQTYPQIEKDYISTGKVKFVYKNLAFLGKESTDAANASFCAREQNKFWEYHDKLFNSQQGENQGAFSIDNLKKFAVDLGLNAGQFNSCLDANKYNADVQADVAEANTNGFNSTPSFAIGTKSLIGAQPYDQFKTLIEAELKK